MVVGAALPPPLIHVTKIPNPAFLPFGGGNVTYTYTVTNPGSADLSDLRVTDEDCANVNEIYGDVNGDEKLNADETWTYTCDQVVRTDTTGLATAKGDANFLTATDYALATVIVSKVPGFPNTGIAPDDSPKPSAIAGFFSAILKGGIAFLKWLF